MKNSREYVHIATGVVHVVKGVGEAASETSSVVPPAAAPGGSSGGWRATLGPTGRSRSGPGPAGRGPQTPGLPHSSRHSRSLVNQLFDCRRGSRAPVKHGLRGGPRPAGPRHGMAPPTAFWDTASHNGTALWLITLPEHSTTHPPDTKLHVAWNAILGHEQVQWSVLVAARVAATVAPKKVFDPVQALHYDWTATTCLYSLWPASSETVKAGGDRTASPQKPPPRDRTASGVEFLARSLSKKLARQRDGKAPGTGEHGRLVPQGYRGCDALEIRSGVRLYDALNCSLSVQTQAQ